MLICGEKETGLLDKNLTVVTKCDNRFIVDGKDREDKDGATSYLHGILILPVTWGRLITPPSVPVLVNNMGLPAGKVDCDGGGLLLSPSAARSMRSFGGSLQDDVAVEGAILRRYYGVLLLLVLLITLRYVVSFEMILPRRSFTIPAASSFMLVIE